MLTLLLNVTYMRLKLLEVFRIEDANRVVYRADKAAKHNGLVKVEAGYTYITYYMQGIANPEQYPIYFNIVDEVFMKGWK